MIAALLFGLHGARPEAVSWMAARFDLLATLAVFAALLLFLHTGPRCSAGRAIAMTLLALFGMLSKESAFVLPGLLLAVLATQPERRHAGAWRMLGATVAAAAFALACRLAVLGGIGGYQTDAGTPTVLDWKPWLFFKAIALRLPAVLTVPINWTGGLNAWLCVSLTAMVVAVLLLAMRSRSSREARLGVLLALISVLPVYHLLQIVEDLERARVVYLAAAGFGLFVAALLQNAGRRLAVTCAIALMAFHVSAMWHNIGHWQRMSELHRRTCRAVAGYAAPAGAPLYAADLPTTVDGVYMLTTGLPECVALRYGVERDRVKLVDSTSKVPAEAADGAIRWNPARRQVERIGRE